ncbi:MAG: SPOR domain-containing protein [Loktanella sp.]|nr:SPOR domain-containing protein [Loktanella sp.]
MAVYDDGAFAVPLTQRASRFVQYSGAALSVALIAGVGVWGYKLVMRDVTGIPVVAAIEGPMRVAPSNPGGDIAPHAGLSVNAVAAEAGSDAPIDRVVLAPTVDGLADEDIALEPTAETEAAPAADPDAQSESEVADAATDDAVTEPADGPLDADDVLALADRIAAGATPMAPLDGDVVEPTLTLDGQEVSAPVLTANFEGPRGSLRPPTRPAQTASATETDAVEAALASAVSVAAPEADVIASAPPAGSAVVQLGAFPSTEVALTEWSRLTGRFGDYLGGRERLIQEASSGGRTFYRLRAMGFDDLSEAQRICAALEAGNAPCIPVVVQ